MAITTTERTKITQLAVVTAPDAYLAELADTYTAAGNSMTALANGLASLDSLKVNFFIKRVSGTCLNYPTFS